MEYKGVSIVVNGAEHSNESDAVEQAGLLSDPADVIAGALFIDWAR